MKNRNSLLYWQHCVGKLHYIMYIHILCTVPVDWQSLLYLLQVSGSVSMYVHVYTYIQQ